MKKITFLTVFAAIFLLLCSCDLSHGEKQTESEHTHSYGDWVVISEATCTSEGKKRGACSCGDTLTEMIPMTEHVILRDLGLSPTCTEQGLSEGVFCAVCYTVFTPQVAIEPTGHFPVTDPAVPPTCTEDGLTEGAHCSVCKEILVAPEKIGAEHSWVTGYDSTSHWQECSVCGLCEGHAAHQGVSGGYCSVCNSPVSPTEGVAYLADADNKFAVVTGYVGSSSSVIIADEYDGLPVRVISKDAFYGKDISTVFIPDSVTVISENAFADCKRLCEVRMSGLVSEIGEGAFKGCSSLEVITLPSTLVRIDRSSFDGCDKLIETENGISYVSDVALYSSGVESAVIRDGTRIIAEYAFAQDDTLISLALPDSLKRIGDGAFSECSNLSSLTIGGTEEIGEFAFYWCRSLKKINLQGSLREIGHSAFLGCVGLTDIDFGDSLVSIAPYAFADCLSLKDITLPTSVQSIGACAFYHCSEIESISLPFVGETKDGEGATHFGFIFGATSSHTLNSSYIPSSLKRVELTSAAVIEDNAFYNCSKIESISLPATVFYIGDRAFYGCLSLSEINIPDGLASLGVDAFSGCDSLKYNEAEGLLYLGNHSNPRLILIRPENEGIESCSIDTQVKFICAGAFKQCTSLKEVIYHGSIEEWERVRIGEDNSPLENANLTLG